jgi:diacylglycerol kinase
VSAPAPGRAPTLLDSFNYAFEGIIHVLRTQRNLRIHFAIAIAKWMRRFRCVRRSWMIPSNA